MCSKLPEKMIKRINVRLALLFSFLFTVSFLFLFGITYFLLSSSLKREDHNALSLKLLSLGAEYRIGGIERLLREVQLEKIFGERAISMVRVADRKNNTLYLLTPAYWTVYDIESLTQKTDSSIKDLFRFQISGNKDILEIASLRLPDDNRLQVGMSIKSREKTLQRFIGISLPIMALVILASFSGGMLFSNRMLEPIRSLTSTVQAIIDTGRIRARIPARHTGDELDKLVTLFNKMLEKIELLVTGMKGALDTVAHDLRTPMTRLRGIAERALQAVQKDKVCGEALASCMEESERILTMLNTFMDISEAETGVLKLNIQEVNIVRVVEEIAELYRYVAEEKNISLSTEVRMGESIYWSRELGEGSPILEIDDQSGSDLLPEITVSVDLQRMRQVVANLLDNALKYTPRGGSVKIATGIFENRVYITVEDNGIGIREDEIQHIWERLYRGYESRSVQGLGLGLSLVKAVVQAHGGNIELESLHGRGSKFTIFISPESKTHQP
jgi:signal transduction histidine kinase